MVNTANISHEHQHIIRVWTFQDALLESYRYAPGPAEELPKHFHDEYQIGVSINFPGEYTYRGARHPVPVGSLNVIHPGEMHSARDTEYRHVYADFRKVYVAPERVRTVAHELTGRKAGLPFFPEPIIFDTDLATLFLDFHATKEEANPLLERETLFTSFLARLIVRHADERHRLMPFKGERDGVRRSREYLRDNYAENVSLGRLAQIAGLSRFHFLRAFHREVGLPPHKYQTQVRVERAKLLIAGGASIQEVAQAVGFVDQSHLNRHFRRLSQVTPGRYIPAK
ncbi:MAG TPA: AraC family transcriptional regulator [Pyrinomonadaceae bacterium]